MLPEESLPKTELPKPEIPTGKRLGNFFTPKFFYILVGVLLLLVIVSLGLFFFLRKKSFEQKNSSSSIETTTVSTEKREVIDAYGRKPVADQDFEPGVVVFGIKQGSFKTNDQEITSEVSVNNLDKDNFSNLLTVFDKYKATALLRPFADQQVLNSVYLLKVPENTDYLSLITELQKDPNVQFAEPNYYARLEYMPNDPFFSSKGSWGQDYDDLWNLKIIDVPKAWDITKGDPSVKVAVVDSGVDHTNPDLEGNVVEGYGGMPGLTLKKGFTGDCAHTHGTHIAGIIAAKGDDNYGVIGVAPGVTIMPFTLIPCQTIPPERLLDFQTERSTVSPIGSFIIEKIGATGYAVLFLKAEAEGVSAINFSSGFPFDSFVLNQAVNYVTDKGVVFVTAAGNEKQSTALLSPQNNMNAIVVSSTDHNDNITGYSNFGSTVTVAAPGGDESFEILSTGSTQTDLKSLIRKGSSMNVGDEHIRLSGTSMAAPHVAGLAALVKSLHPDWTEKKIRCAIIQGADDKGPSGWDKQYGYGRINAYKTLSLKDVPDKCEPIAKITDPVTNSGVEMSSAVPIEGTAISMTLDYYTLEYLMEGADPQTGWQLIRKDTERIIESTLGVWDASNLPEGNYQLRLTVVDKGTMRKAVHEISVYLFKIASIGDHPVPIYPKHEFVGEKYSRLDSLVDKTGKPAWGTYDRDDWKKYYAISSSYEFTRIWTTSYHSQDNTKMLAQWYKDEMKKMGWEIYRELSTAQDIQAGESRYFYFCRDIDTEGFWEFEYYLPAGKDEKSAYRRYADMSERVDNKDGVNIKRVASITIYFESSAWCGYGDCGPRIGKMAYKIECNDGTWEYGDILGTMVDIEMGSY